MEHLEMVLTPKQASDRLGVTEAHLQRLRSEGGGPAFTMLGRRRIGYRATDINSWLASRVSSSTAEARERGLTAA